MKRCGLLHLALNMHTTRFVFDSAYANFPGSDQLHSSEAESFEGVLGLIVAIAGYNVFAISAVDKDLQKLTVSCCVLTFNVHIAQRIH